MPNRRIKVLALLLVVIWLGFYCQAIPVKGQANRTISSRAPSSLDDEDQRAIADDDSDDSSDDLILLRGTLNTLPYVAAVASFQGHSTLNGAANAPRARHSRHSISCSGCDPISFRAH